MSAVPVTALRAVTRRLAPGTWAAHPWRADPDVLFERDGWGFAGRGAALRVPAAVVASALASFDVDDEVGAPGTGPVAFAALPFAALPFDTLPFDTEAPADFVVPAGLVVRSPGGGEWETVVDGVSIRADRPWGAEPDGFSLRSPVPHDRWEEAVAKAVSHIRLGDVAKVVLAREVLVEANRPIVVPTVLRRLRALYPSCTTFLVDGFLGASPEVLVARTGSAVRSRPLGGTRPHSGDPAVDAAQAALLLGSDKDRREHAVIVDAVAGILGPLCDRLDVPATPSIVPLRNVLHLGTPIEGRLRTPAPTLLELANLLHPTPAVGGAPREAALALIAQLEPTGRGRYAGPVGWVDRRGDGEMVLGIRSASIDGARASMWAGVGVVVGSETAAELAETQFKLQALLAAIVRP
ncbi:MAG: isochorismate synthase [Acidimicrobiales bacterium]